MERTINESGFTLIELAVVLVLIGIMLSGLLMPLRTQVEQRARRETEQQLDAAREALLGYVVAYGYLPCPSTERDPASAGYGEEDARVTGVCQADAGLLPWRTLGIAAIDAWGRERSAATDSWSGYLRYRVHTNFSSSAKPIALTTVATSGAPLSVVTTAGKALSSTAEPPVAIIYSTGPGNADNDAAGLSADGENADGDPDAGGTSNAIYAGGEATATFDDLITWMARPVLFAKLVSAGRLP
jgi:prepilin-type N-terminal cleavage/methylation domain-containing protein